MRPKKVNALGKKKEAKYEKEPQVLCHDRDYGRLYTLKDSLTLRYKYIIMIKPSNYLAPALSVPHTM